MRARTLMRLAPPLVLAVLISTICVAALSAATGTTSGVAVAAGHTSDASAATGTDGIQPNEVDPGALSDGGAPVVNRSRPGDKNGKFPPKPLAAPSVASSSISAPGAELGASFQGMNHRDQRLANGGNQFSLEPPDQGLCAGNGRVIEAINDVIRIYSPTGAPISGTVDLNTFYGYQPAVGRGGPFAGQFGPEMTDPSCIYDADIGRWVVIDLTLDRVGVTSTLSGVNHLDIAVSPNASPTSLAGWTIYKIDLTDDGTNGTPNHGCTSTHATHPGAAIGDYPHIGADANGIYVTTNEYCFFGNGYNGAQVYAIGKQQLAGATLPSSISFVHVENAQVDGTPGFTVWPAQSQPGQYATDNGGTEYFASTIAGDGSETGNPTGTARRIGIWALTNTSSLNTPTPSVLLTSRLVNSEDYVFPPRSNQKVGDIPLGACINDTSSLFGPGIGCWGLLFGAEPSHTEVESSPDSNDTRMQQVWYTGGKLYTAADTAVDVGGSIKAGVAWFVVNPKINGHSTIEGKIENQGYLGLAGNNITYPAWATLPNGKGVMAFTVVGSDYYPSAGYAVFDGNGFGAIHLAGTGVGPADGFTSYKAEVGDPPRTRWGDYGAAVPVGNSIWIASEWIGQTCTLSQWLSGAIGSCGGTRTALGNWSTRVSQVTP